MTDEQIKHMVNRFLAWKLPENFHPDAGARFAPTDMQRSGIHPWPVGTNLLDYTQAEEMVRHMIDGLPQGSVTYAGQ